MSKTAILITSIARPKLLEKCVASWANILPSDKFAILIAEQGAQTSAVTEVLKAWGGEYDHDTLSFDAGISASRNHLVKKAQKRGYGAVIICADSIHGCPEFSTDKVLAAAKLITNELAIVGFDIKGRIPWTYGMQLSEEGFVLSKLDKRTFVKTSPRIKMCDICANFFIAQTEVLAKVGWDNNLKLAEHESFFWELGQAGYLCAWTDEIAGQYVKETSAEYAKLRNRLYAEYKKKLLAKYKMTGWIKITES